jgi:hypothetical protein
MCGGGAMGSSWPFWLRPTCPTRIMEVRYDDIIQFEEQPARGCARYRYLIQDRLNLYHAAQRYTVHNS